jgi:hypothetical protein
MRLLSKFTLMGRSALCFVFVAGTIALMPTQADAASFTVDLCDANALECTEDNLLEASLTFDEILSGTDPNDYTLTMTLTGEAGATGFIDQVSFTINGVDNVTGDTGYEVKPTVTSPAGWTVYYDNVSNATSCTSDTNQSQEVCANSAGSGVTTEGVNTWIWDVNISDALGAIGVGTGLNLRAHFLTAAGAPGGNFSPGGTTVTTEVTTTTDITTVITSTENLPEPTLLTLLGAGLAGVSLRMRRRKA